MASPVSSFDAGKQPHRRFNPLTREWLMLFLTDLGIEAADGELTIAIV